MDGGDWGGLIGAVLVLAVLVAAAIHSGPNDPTAA